MSVFVRHTTLVKGATWHIEQSELRGYAGDALQEKSDEVFVYLSFIYYRSVVVHHTFLVKGRIGQSELEGYALCG